MQLAVCLGGALTSLAGSVLAPSVRDDFILITVSQFASELRISAAGVSSRRDFVSPGVGSCLAPAFKRYRPTVEGRCSLEIRPIVDVRCAQCPDYRFRKRTSQ